MAIVNLVVGCAKRKTQEPRASLRLRAVRSGKTVGRRASAWAARLRAQSATVPAGDLYAGEHWCKSSVQLPGGRSRRSASGSCRPGTASSASTLRWPRTRLPSHPGRRIRSVRCQSGAAMLAALAEFGGRAVADASHASFRASDDCGRRRCSPRRTFCSVALPAAYSPRPSHSTWRTRLRLALRAVPSRLAVLSAGGGIAPEAITPYLLPVSGSLTPGFAGGTKNAHNARLARRHIEELRHEPLTQARCREAVAEWHCKATDPKAPTRCPGHGRGTR